MKSKNKFLRYIGVSALALLFVAIVCFAIMFLFPGTTILGYKYVNEDFSHNYVYSNATEQSVEDVNEIAVTTQLSNIVFYVSDYSNVLNVTYSHKINGFTSDEGKTNYNAFTTANSTGKTFNISTSEKYSGLTTNESYIYVYLPQNFVYNKISASTKSGNISFASKTTEATLNVDKVDLSCEGSGNITLLDTTGVNDYYFTTAYGGVNFSKTASLNANSVTFNTISGEFSLSGKDTQLNLTSKFTMNATGKGKMSVDNVNCDLYINSHQGSFSFENIGSTTTQQNVYISGDYVNFNCQKLYGYISVIKLYNLNVSNNVYINTLNCSTSDDCVFEVGGGSLTIDNTGGNISSSSTSGNIILKQVSNTSNICAYAGSGGILVNFVEGAMSNDTTTRIFTKTGDVYLKNVVNNLYVEVLEDSEKADLKISFRAIHNDKNNMIIAKNRTANLTWLGDSGELCCKLLTNTPAYFYSTASETEISNFASLVESTDDDFIEDSDYSRQYRVGYKKESIVSAQNAGKLILDSTKGIKIFID